jgi:hypothetical protein
MLLPINVTSPPTILNNAPTKTALTIGKILKTRRSFVRKLDRGCIGYQLATQRMRLTPQESN